VVADVCTGCELCVAPCPVDCITMVPRASESRDPTPELNRARYYAHTARLTRRAEAQAALLAARKQTAGELSAASSASHSPRSALTGEAS
jgi:electron transport complex protein RnfB